MWFEVLEDRVLLASDLDPALQSVIKTGAASAGTLVDVLHDRIFERVIHRTQPLIANALQVKDTANDQLNVLSNTVQTALATLSAQPEVTSANVTAALTTALNTLVGGALQSVTVTAGAPTLEEIRYTLTLDGKIVDRTVPFDLGLSSVLTATGGNVDVDLGYTTQIVLGFRTAFGVFIDTASANEFNLDLAVTMASPQLTGRMGPLRLTATDNANQAEAPTGLVANFTVNLTDTDNRLRTADVGSLQVAANLSGDATVNLKLLTDLSSTQLPSLSTDLLIQWHVNESPDMALSSWGDVPVISFSDVTLDAGSFFNNLVAPVFDQIDAALTPVQPVLEVLSTRMPVLSEIAGEDITLAEVIEELGGEDANLGIISAVADFYILYQDLSNIAQTGTVVLGSFTIGNNANGTPVDARILSSLTSVTEANFAEVVRMDPTTADPVVGQFLTSTRQDSFEGGFEFPILELAQTAFDLFLGKDVDLFRLDLPVLKADFPFSLPFIPVIPPLGIRFSGEFAIGADLGFGYDTSGLRQWANTNFDPVEEELVFDGFFFRDQLNGQDNPELFVQARVQAAAEVNVAFAGVGVGAAIIATVGLDLRDRVVDGKVHPSEVEQNIVDLGPLCGLFEHTGSIDAALTAYAKLGIGPISVEVSRDLITVRLIDFTFPCTPGGEPVLAHLDEDTNELTLFTGPLAYKRYEQLPVEFRPEEPDIDETYIVRKIGEEEGTGLDILEVRAFGKSEFFTGVSSVVADGGKGNDIIQLNQSASAVAYFDGGPGNDRLVAGSGGGILHGDSGSVAGIDGDDEIGGYGGFFQLFGDGGNDLIHGGPIGDLMSGGDGDDLMFGNGGDDIMGGGFGRDLMHGGVGVDVMSGNDDDDDVRGDEDRDVLFGNDGNDILRGGEGNNEAWGGIGNDFIHTLGGVDLIYGEAGDDEVLAGAGIDTVYGGSENDEIHGEAGDDLLFGEAGVDTIFGDADNDTLHGGTEGDEIHGGTGNDFRLWRRRCRLDLRRRRR